MRPDTLRHWAMQITVQPNKAEHNLFIEVLSVSKFRITAHSGKESQVFLGDLETCARAIDHLISSTSPFPPLGNHLALLREALMTSRTAHVAEWSQEGP